MREQRIHPDDPRLTAYALGELDADECREVERLLDNSPECQHVVDEILVTAGILFGHLRPFSDENDAAAAKEKADRASAPQAAGPAGPAKAGARRARGRTFALMAALAVNAAAAVAVILFLWSENRGGNRFSAQSQQRPVETRDGALPLVVMNDNSDGRGRAENLSGNALVVTEGHGQLSTSNGIPTRAFEINSNASNVMGRQSADSPTTGDPMTLSPARPDSIPRAVRLQTEAAAPQAAPPAAPVQTPEDQYRRELEALRQQLPTAATEGEAAPDSSAENAPAHSEPTSAPATRLGITANPNFTENSAQDFSYGEPSPATDKVARPAVSAGVQPTSTPLTWEQLPEPNDDGSRERFWYHTPQLGKPPSPSAESYAPIVENEFLTPQKHPLSTFSIDVDTAAYANVRRFITNGQRPPKDAVRIEELVNYFTYETPAAPDGEPFGVALDLAACPWNGEHYLVRIGLKAREIPQQNRPPSNLVFLVDVSGSMRDHNKLPLVKSALELLVDSLTENDRIAIVTYADGAHVALPSTSGHEKELIRRTIGALEASGSTNGEGGLKLAYEAAQAALLSEGTNRVILCTDGDFNVGVTDNDELVRIIRERARGQAIFLSIFGFGMDNLKDDRLQKLADEGNGHYGYIDGLREARKAFFDELTGTLYTVAKDVKLQVEFNPARVGAYRLIGYENRLMAAPDFNNDRKDAGDIGAGHSVTALYELVPAGKPIAGTVDDLKYQQPTPQPAVPAADKVLTNELLTLKLRYKRPEADESVKLQEFPLSLEGEKPPEPSKDLQWAAAVAAYGMLLRDSQYKGSASFDLVEQLAKSAGTDDPTGRRAEFLDLVRMTRTLSER